MKNTGVLIVDDSGEIRMVIKDVVRKMGVKDVFEATDGDEALQILSGRDEHDDPVCKKVHLMICDINMPKMTGLELLNEIRKRDEMKKLAVIIITGESTEQKILEAVKLGANDFVAKPYTVQTMEEKIKKVLKKKPSQKR